MNTQHGQQRIGGPTTFACEPGLEARGLALGDLDGDGLDEIIVGFDTAGGMSLRVFSAADVQSGKASAAEVAEELREDTTQLAQDAIDELDVELPESAKDDLAAAGIDVD